MSPPASAPAATPAPRRRRPAAAADGDAARPTLTPDTWIQAATEVLVDRGIDHVRVDLLATRLGVTRGSFYWHFRDREDLLRRVLKSWRDAATNNLTARLMKARDDPLDQMRDIISLPFRGRSAARAARIELAIRAWARRDETARHAVDEADASRIAYIAQIFSSLGYPILEARARAFLLYSYVVGESMLNQGDAAQRAERARFVEHFMRPAAAG